jgi:8-oxo-dGTP diphosphatase
MQQKRFKIVPASYLILIKSNKILMLRRFNTGYQDGNYALVAGHLNGNESFQNAIIRESKEEANIILQPKDLSVAHVMNRYDLQNDLELREKVDVFFVAKKWQGEIKNMEPNKCDDLSWFPIDKLPANTIPYIKKVISNVRKKIFYSEFGY